MLSTANTVVVNSSNTANNNNNSNKRKQTVPKSKPAKCCNRCSFSTNEIGEFIEHMKCDHNLEDVYSCEMCAFYTETLWDYQVHMEQHQTTAASLSPASTASLHANDEHERKKSLKEEPGVDAEDQEANHNQTNEEEADDQEEEEEEEGNSDRFNLASEKENILRHDRQSLPDDEEECDEEEEDEDECDEEEEEEDDDENDSSQQYLFKKDALVNKKVSHWLNQHSNKKKDRIFA